MRGVFFFSPGFYLCTFSKLFQKCFCIFLCFDARALPFTFESSAMTFFEFHTHLPWLRWDKCFRFLFHDQRWGRTATDWTRPAEVSSCLELFSRGIGETSEAHNSIKDSSCLLSIDEIHVESSWILESCFDSFLGDFGIGDTFCRLWIETSASQRCQPIASHSRSSSVAIYIVSADFTSFSDQRQLSSYLHQWYRLAWNHSWYQYPFFLLEITYVTDWGFDCVIRSEILFYGLCFAGDSTITRFCHAS